MTPAPQRGCGGALSPLPIPFLPRLSSWRTTWMEHAPRPCRAPRSCERDGGALQILLVTGFHPTAHRSCPDVRIVPGPPPQLLSSSQIPTWPTRCPPFPRGRCPRPPYVSWRWRSRWSHWDPARPSSCHSAERWRPASSAAGAYCGQAEGQLSSWRGP